MLYNICIMTLLIVSTMAGKTVERRLLNTKVRPVPTEEVVLSAFDKKTNFKRRLHGYLTSPVPRGGAISGQGTKIPGTNFDLTTCSQGDSANKPSAVPTAANTFSPGQTLTVNWKITIEHDSGQAVGQNGVRIAIRYPGENGNTFASQGQILKTAFAPGLNGDRSTTVTLPQKQGRAELMWSWTSLSDGGYYVTCADIQIGQATGTGNQQGTTTGTSNNNNNNNNNNAGAANGNVNGNSPSAAGGGSGDVVVIVICSLIMIIAIGGVVWYARQPGGGGGGRSQQPNTQQPTANNLPRIKSMRPKSIPKGLRATTGLPYGWHATTDVDGDTYYYNDDGRTSWEIPS
jgi:hypothetical protein